MISAQPQTSHPTLERTRGSILVVGDVALGPRVMQRLAAFGFTIQRALDADDGLGTWTERVPAAIALAPFNGADPFAVVRRIRTLDRAAFVPIFVFAAGSDGLRVSEGIAAGADDVFDASRDQGGAAEQMVARIARARVLGQLALIDPLTELYNRRVMDDRVTAEISRAARGEKLLSLCLLDIDDFKSVNDLLGHSAGDRALVAFAQALRRNVRGYDIVCRFGGDEFVVVLPECGAEGARATLSHLRARRAWARDDLPPITFSAGVAQFPDDGRTLAELFEVADRNARHAKAHGRNSTVGRDRR